MLLAAAAVLAFLWIISFFVLHFSDLAVHVLLFGAALSAFVHFIRVRRVSATDRPIKP
jgi:hypothetical protein